MVTLTTGVTTGGSIDAANYNLLQTEVAQILGTGLGDKGYGQSLSSSQVTANDIAQGIDGDLVTATQMDYLRSDIEKCWKHQVTTAFTLGDVSVGDWITAGSASTTGTYNQYFSYVTSIINNRHLLASGQYTDTLQQNNSVPTGWTSSRSAEYTVSFGTTEAMRFFFNSGGQIQFTWATGAAGTGASASKNTSWANFLGTVPYTSTYQTYTGYTSSWAAKINTGVGGSGVYAENKAVLNVRLIDSNTTINYQWILQDLDSGDDTTPNDGWNYKTDEPVTLPINCRLTTRTATGSYVSRTAPTTANTTPWS